MRILLDTHCWLWALGEPQRLSAQARALIADRGNEIFLSAASAWEISIKHALGKLTLPVDPAEYVPQRIEASGVSPLPIDVRHALLAGELPAHHRDPFDRLLVAQARLEGLTLMTADALLRPYQADLFWAT